MKKTAIAASLLCLCLWAVSAPSEKKRELPEGRLEPPRPNEAGVAQSQVTQGTPGSAKAYYNGLKESLKLPLATIVPAPAGGSGRQRTNDLQS